MRAWLLVVVAVIALGSSGAFPPMATTAMASVVTAAPANATAPSRFDAPATAAISSTTPRANASAGAFRRYDAARDVSRAWRRVSGAVSAAKAGGSGRTTVLGENMADRVVPYAERTGGRTVDMVSPDDWARMTPRQRWKANDGALRTRIREGDRFSYIGRDPDRPDWARRKFDLTGSELLRLGDRGVPFEIVSRSRVRQVIGRP
jgi:hypothetical protein